MIEEGGHNSPPMILGRALKRAISKRVMRTTGAIKIVPVEGGEEHAKEHAKARPTKGANATEAGASITTSVDQLDSSYAAASLMTTEAGASAVGACAVGATAALAAKAGREPSSRREGTNQRQHQTRAAAQKQKRLQISDDERKDEKRDERRDDASKVWYIHPDSSVLSWCGMLTWVVGIWLAIAGEWAPTAVHCTCP
jgi:hypothetical protein